MPKWLAYCLHPCTLDSYYCFVLDKGDFERSTWASIDTTNELDKLANEAAAMIESPPLKHRVPDSSNEGDSSKAKAPASLQMTKKVTPRATAASNKSVGQRAPSSQAKGSKSLPKSAKSNTPSYPRKVQQSTDIAEDHSGANEVQRLKRQLKDVENKALQSRYTP